MKRALQRSLRHIPSRYVSHWLMPHGAEKSALAQSDGELYDEALRRAVERSTNGKMTTDEKGLPCMNSKQKGKRIELLAVHYLHALGFDQAKRGQQNRGGADSPDVIAPELSNVHFEIKGAGGVDVGTQALVDAYTQSMRDAKEFATPVVMWKPDRKAWRLTMLVCGCLATVTGDLQIKKMLGVANAGGV